MLVVLGVGVASRPGVEDVRPVDLVVIEEAGEPGREEAGPRLARFGTVGVEGGIRGRVREVGKESCQAPLEPFPLKGVTRYRPALRIRRRRCGDDGAGELCREASRGDEVEGGGAAEAAQPRRRAR